MDELTNSEYDNKVNILINNFIKQYSIANIKNDKITVGLYENSLELLILHTIMKKMPKLNLTNSFEQICLFVYMCKFILNYDDIDILNIFGIVKYSESDDEKINFVTFYGHKFPTSYFVKYVSIFVPCDFYDAKIVIDHEAKNEYTQLKITACDKMKNIGSKRLNNFKSSFTNKTNFLVFESTSELHEEYIQNETSKFIENIKLNGNLITKDKKKIKIYNVAYKEIIETTEVPNDEYESYIKLKEKALNEPKKTTDDKNNVCSEIDILKFLSLTPPPKTIKTEKKFKKIEKNFVKEIYKNIDTIYLREKDMTKIKSFLENFKYNKEIIQELGISDKLIVLLYGLPGTGKTSLIYVIACFLQKDIYYVNFSKIRTNKDYQDIINFVQKNCGNAIIIFEDIDATTNVVHQRNENTKDLTVNELIDAENDTLTLSYMLNSLDGALTSDGSVIIMTTNYINKLDKAIHRPGRVDVKIEMKKCDHHQIKAIYKKFIKRDLPQDILNKIESDKFIPAEIIQQMRICMNDIDNLSDVQIMEPFMDKNFIDFYVDDSMIDVNAINSIDKFQDNMEKLMTVSDSTCKSEKSISDENSEKSISDEDSEIYEEHIKGVDIMDKAMINAIKNIRNGSMNNIINEFEQKQKQKQEQEHEQKKEQKKEEEYHEVL